MKALEIKYFCKFVGKNCIFSLTLSDFKLIFYHLKPLEFKEFCKFKLTKSVFFLHFVKFPDHISKTPIFS